MGAIAPPKQLDQLAARTCRSQRARRFFAPRADAGRPAVAPQAAPPAWLYEERGDLELDFLADWPVDEAKTWLTSIKGVGPKTAAIVLLFAALFLLVKILRGLLKDRLAGLFSKTLFRNSALSFVVGLFTPLIIIAASAMQSVDFLILGMALLAGPKLLEKATINKWPPGWFVPAEHSAF